MIVRWQYDLEKNTKENALPVCDKPHHTNKSKLRKGLRLKFCGTVRYLKSVAFLNSEAQVGCCHFKGKHSVFYIMQTWWNILQIYKRIAVTVGLSSIIILPWVDFFLQNSLHWIYHSIPNNNAFDASKIQRSKKWLAYSRGKTFFKCITYFE